MPTQQVRIDEGLYESSVSYCLEKIKETDDAVNTLMVFGHNPDFTDLTNQFLDGALSDLPTSGVVKLDFLTDTWKNIDKSTLKKHTLFFPPGNRRL